MNSVQNPYDIPLYWLVIIIPIYLGSIVPYLYQTTNQGEMNTAQMVATTSRASGHVIFSPEIPHCGLSIRLMQTLASKRRTMEQARWFPIECRMEYIGETCMPNIRQLFLYYYRVSGWKWSWRSLVSWFISPIYGIYNLLIKGVK